MIKGKVASFIEEDVNEEIQEYFSEQEYVKETNEIVESFKNYVDWLLQTK